MAAAAVETRKADAGVGGEPADAEAPTTSKSAAQLAQQSAAKEEEEDLGVETESDDDGVDEGAIRMSTAVVESMITVLRQTFLQKSALQTTFQGDILMPTLGDKGQYDLKDFQQAGVKWLLFNYFTCSNCILADEMGLGKTIQVIAFLAWLIEGGQHTRDMLQCDKDDKNCLFQWPYQPQFLPPLLGLPSLANNVAEGSNLPLAVGPNASGPHLIVVPSSLVENWQREFERFYPSAKLVTIAGTAKARSETIKQLLKATPQLKNVNVFLTSYKTVEAGGKFKTEDSPEWFQLLGAIGRPFVTMTLDEGHTLKSSKTAAFKTLHGTPSLFRLLLTGTPIQNNINELVNLMAFLSGDILLRAMHEYTQGLGKGHGRKLAAEPGDLHVWNEIMEDGILSEALDSFADSLSRWVTTATQRDLDEAASAHAAVAESEGVSVATAAALEKAATSKLSGLLDTMVLRRTKQQVLRSALPEKSVMDLALGMMPTQKLLYEAAVRCLRSPEKYKPAAASGAGEMPPPSTPLPATELPFIWGLTDVIGSGKKYSGNAMALLRKLAGHPLLARVHYTDEDVVALAARMVHSERPGSVPAQLLKSRRLRLGPHQIPRCGPATREHLAALACGNMVVARTAERMLDMSDLALHEVATDEDWASMRLPDSCFLDSNKVQMVLGLLAKAGKNSKVVVFSQFTSVLDLLETACDLKDIKRARLDGSTLVADRMIAVDQFQGDPETRLFLASTKAGGVGLNLTAAKYAVLLDPDFNPTNDAQCEDRIHRIGQTQPCTVIKVAARGSIEEHIASIAARKVKLQGAVLSDASSQRQVSSRDEEREALQRALYGEA